MTITYAITAHNEYVELMNLLRTVQFHIQQDDELLILLDRSHTEEVKEISLMAVNALAKRDISAKLLYYSLDGDFAKFKNRLFQECTKDYVFFIDADEMPSEILLENIKQVIEMNPVDVIMVPRKNTVDRLEKHHIDKWHWHVDEHGRVNWPDYQMRIVANKPHLRWKNKVHEVISGHTSMSHLPTDNEHWCLFHHKSIERQVKQNELYDRL